MRTLHESVGRTRIWATRCVLLVFLLIVATACGNDETPTPEPTNTPVPVQPSADNALGSANVQPELIATPTPEPTLDDVHLVLWHSWAGAEGDALNEMLGAAQNRYPSLTVDTLFVGYADLAQSYADAVLAGGGPDLVVGPNWWLGDLVATGAVVSLGDLATPAMLDAYWPAAVDNLRWAGKLYGLPTNVELVSLFYNRALVDDARLPTTTDDLLTLARENPVQGTGLYASLYHVYWGLPAYGATLLDDDGLITLDRNNGAADFLTWFVEADQTPGNFVDVDYGSLIDRFKKGEYAFFVDGPWATDELRGALGANLAMTVLPAGPAGAAQPWLSADGIFINPNGEPIQRKNAFIFAQFLTNAESGSTLARRARLLPANRNANVGDDAILQGFMAQAASAQSMPTVPEMDEVWGYGGDMLLKVLAGAAPATIVRETTALINDATGK